MGEHRVSTSDRVDDAAARQAATLIGTVVERVFHSVAAVRDGVLDAHRAARQRGEPMADRDVTAMRDTLVDLLRSKREIAVGMGVIVAPGFLADQPLRVEWWQCEPERGDPRRLDVDLNPHSVGFYDYAAADWFVVPRRTGHRHVVGPYVDVHGTDRYLLTLTVPVVADGEFVGVAGADIPVGRFETLVLRELGDLAVDVVVVNPEDRVVLSTSARWLAGSLATPAAMLDAARVRTVTLADPPWQVVVFPG
ncbi:hypothetical protein GCM10010464_50610 [Pseudonocardia yunnanensis]|uniref:Cache domain-containing protein n=1 Tax=Pseudonocardia yunnanensis TaxID=58107 RepID=A0ABW4EJW2_9PSEU